MTSSSDSASSQAAALAGMYGDEHRLCSTANPKLALVLSCEREIDLFELEQLCDAAGCARPSTTACSGWGSGAMSRACPGWWASPAAPAMA